MLACEEAQPVPATKYSPQKEKTNCKTPRTPTVSDESFPRASMRALSEEQNTAEGRYYSSSNQCVGPPTKKHLIWASKP